jgi:hypothetical protein
MTQLPRWPPLGNPADFSQWAEKDSNLFRMLVLKIRNVKLIWWQQELPKVAAAPLVFVGTSSHGLIYED